MGVTLGEWHAPCMLRPFLEILKKSAYIIVFPLTSQHSILLKC